MKYSKLPLNQADVHAAVKLGTSTKNYGRLVTDMYLPALSTSLQLHFRVLTNVQGYYALMHAYYSNGLYRGSSKSMGSH